jgi:Nuclease-related domain
VHDVHVPNRGNADHVVIGRSGLFVLETKYTNHSDRDDRYQRQRLEGAAWQSKDMARHVRFRLRSNWFAEQSGGVLSAAVQNQIHEAMSSLWLTANIDLTSPVSAVVEHGLTALSEALMLAFVGIAVVALGLSSVSNGPLWWVVVWALFVLMVIVL